MTVEEPLNVPERGINYTDEKNGVSNGTPATYQAQRVEDFDFGNGPEPIAIIGMGCRLPGDSSSPSKLWELLREEKHGQCKVPASRWNVDAFYHPNGDRPGSMNTNGGYFITEDLRCFDNSFFGINNLETTYMDPQQRKLLEVVFECFENAGVSLDQASAANIGCYVGNFSFDFPIMQTKDTEYLHRYSATGMGTTILANRISHAFNLRGPSFVLDTACSSTLYCLHAACTAIAAGECDSAIVAGANLVTTPEQHLGTMKAGVLSPTSFCHTFDASADGYARADGVGSLLIKPLSAALRDRDPIRAVVRGTAVNANGKTAGITLPSATGQEAVIRKAYAQAGLEYSDTAYVECHGTGTPVGDPIEVEALSRVFSPTRAPDNPILVGSVKTNLGHSEASSGLSGIIKCVLALENRVIPATVGIKKFNPKLKLDEWKVKVVTKTIPWPMGLPVRRASVNSFGYGGANAHAILEAVDSFLSGHGGKNLEPKYPPPRKTFLLPVSGNTEKSMKARVTGIPTDVDLVDLAYTLGCRRTHFANRGFLLVDIGNESADINVDKLVSSSGWQDTHEFGFVFTGQGAQWAQMGKQLMEQFPTFLATIRELDTVLKTLVLAPAWTLEDCLMEPAETSVINDVSRSQPVCTALQIALLRLLKSWGVKPRVTVGHSSGEMAAAYAAGLFTAPQAIIAAYFRGYVFGKNKLKGAMMAVGLSPDLAQQSVNEAGLQNKVVVACVNSPESVTLSGDATGVDQMIEILSKDGIFARKLNTGGRAYHSHHAITVGDEYQALLDETLPKWRYNAEAREGGVHMYSSVYGGKVMTEELPGAYWRKNLESPVLFSQAVEQITKAGNYQLIELGPHSALELPLKQIRKNFGLSEEQMPYLSALTRGKDAVKCVLNLIGNLFIKGYTMDFARSNALEIPTRTSIEVVHAGKTLTNLPRYQWDYEAGLKFKEPRASYEYRNRQYQRHDLIGSQTPTGNGIDFIWRNLLKVSDVPWLSDHKLDTTIVFPAAGYLAMAMEAVVRAKQTSAADVSDYTFRHVNVRKALVLREDDSEVELFTSLRREALTTNSTSTKWYEFEISSMQAGNPIPHCTGKISTAAPETSLETVKQSGLDLHGLSPTSMRGWYEKLAKEGLNYGTAFRPISDIQTPRDGQLSRAVATLPFYHAYNLGKYEEFPYVVHPITIDACLQAAIIASYKGNMRILKAKVPVFIEHCHIRKPTLIDEVGENQVTIDASSEKQGFESFKASCTLRDSSNNSIIEMKEVKLAHYDGAAPSEAAERHPCLRVVCKPDITTLNEAAIPFLRSYLEKYANSNAQSTQHKGFRKFLGCLDLLVHKDPALKILELGENIRKTQSILSTLNAGDEFKRVGKYSIGRLSEGGSFFAEDVDAQSKLPTGIKISREPSAAFDVILLTEEYSTSEYVANEMTSIRKLLAPSGVLLILSAEGAEVPILQKAGFDTLKCPVNGHTNGANILIAFDKSTDKPADYECEVVLVSDRQSNPLAAALGKELKKQYRSFRTLAFESVDKASIPKGSKVINTMELETALLAHMGDTEMNRVKVITDNASEIVWLTGNGFLEAKTADFGLANGLSRALMLEQPSTRFRTFDVNPSYAYQNLATTCANILKILQDVSRKFPSDTEFVEQQGVVHISRFAPDVPLNFEFQQKLAGRKALRPLSESQPARLAIQNLGQLDTLHFKQESYDTTPLKADYVDIDVKAIGLNAKDIYALAGRVDTRDGTCTLEFSGVVRNVGPAVSELKPGDRVVVMAPSYFKTTERVPAWACQKLKDDEEYCAVASLPMVYSTAIYALRHRANLQRGESVLIHSGAGGVGMAAIELAQGLGCEIFTTVSTQDKRDFLVNRFGLQEDHIFNSRDSTFVGDVLTATKGKGVNVVLNSLTGDLLHDSWRCCANFGRFVEIGKIDIVNAGKLDMELFSRNITFTAFDITNLYYHEHKDYNDVWRDLVKETMELYRAKKIHIAQPLKVFDIAETEQAYRYFSSKNRLGKIVISLENPESLIKLEPRKYNTTFSPEKSYIMVGCLGGLGRSLSKWMISRGARKFVYLARSGADKPAPKALVEELKQAGADMKVVRGDVSKYEAVVSAVEACDGPIGGVVQAAMGLSEALFTTMTNEAWQTGIKPKFDGTYHLHNALAGKDADLDFFLLTSSVSGSVGTATESNYCAANNFLDTFSRWRHNQGKPAQSVGLGMISEVGYLHENPEIEALLLRKGIQPLDEEEFLQIIDLSLSDTPEKHSDEYNYDTLNFPHILTGLEPLGIRALRAKGFEVNSPVTQDPRAAILAAALSDGESSSADSGRFQGLPSAVRKVMESEEEITLKDAILVVIKKMFSNLVLVPFEQVDVRKSLSDYGMDSMIAAEWRTWFYQTFKVDIPFLELLSKTVTIKSLSETVEDVIESAEN